MYIKKASIAGISMTVVPKKTSPFQNGFFGLFDGNPFPQSTSKPAKLKTRATIIVVSKTLAFKINATVIIIK